MRWKERPLIPRAEKKKNPLRILKGSGLSGLVCFPCYETPNQSISISISGG